MLLAGGAGHSQNLSGVVNNYYKVLGIDFTTDVVKVDNPSFLNTGQKALLIQMKGAVIDQSTPASNTNWGNVSSIASAGQWELVTVCGINGDSVIFERDIKNTYDVNGQVQLVVFPDKITNATVVDSVFAAPWDSVSGKGGVVFISVSDTLFLNDNIVATGKGFKGAVYTNYPEPPHNCNSVNVTAFALGKPASGPTTAAMKGEGIARHVPNYFYGKGRLANGGGGGNAYNTGGAGGANWGAGGQGGVRARVAFLGCVGNNPGLGGSPLSTHINTPTRRLFLGGGGGAGHGNDNYGLPGGDGGGIVFIKSKVISGNGRTIYANGDRPHRYMDALSPDSTASNSDGAGGGGAGGTAILYADEVINNLTVNVNGANGARSEQGLNNFCMGTGGGGGGGAVHFSLAALPPGVTVTATGGTGGTRINGYTGGYCDPASYPNGSAAGGSGNTLFNLSFTELDTTLRCWAVLPVALFVNVHAVVNNNGVNLNWSVSDAYYTAEFLVEQSTDGRRFAAAGSVAAADKYAYSISLPWNDGTVYYRIKALGKNGQQVYSRIIKVNGKASFAEVEINPNPVHDQLRVMVHLKKPQSVICFITDATGRLIRRQPYNLPAGQQMLVMDQPLAPGLYQFTLTGEAFQVIRSFIYF